MKFGVHTRVRVKCTAIQYPGRCGIVVADSAPGELVKVEFEDEAIAHLFTEDELQPLLDAAHHSLKHPEVISVWTGDSLFRSQFGRSQ